MKTISLKTEWILWLLTILPVSFLFLQWEQLPERIPLHFGLDGKADQWGSKDTLQWLIPIVSLSTYLLLLVIPVIDPRKRILSMGKKFFSLRLVIIAGLAAILLFYIYSCYNQDLRFTDFLFPLLAILLILLGNYLQSVKPNYFIGIRTPWALDDDNNWRETHRIGSKVYIGGGLVLLLAWLFISKIIATFFLPVLVLILLVPVVYSYYFFYRKKK